MMIKRIFKYILIAVLAVVIMEPALAQRWKLRRYDVGGGIGMTQIFGDIGGTIDKSNWFGLKDIQFDETSLAIPLYIRYRLDPVYTVKVNTTLAFGHGDDHETRNDRYLAGRGRSYKTMLFEFSAVGEYYFIAEERRYKSAAMFNRRGMLNNYMSFSAYVFAGIGGVYAHAREIIVPDPAPYDLVKESSVGVVFPFGIGTKYTIDDRWLVSAELGYRYSLNDYLEGYRQDRDSRYNDVYYFLNLTVFRYFLDNTNISEQ